MRQLPLPIELKDSALFATFCPGRNALAVSHLRELAMGSLGPGAWVWGTGSTGKSHLLQAVCASAGAHEIAAAYLPMGQMLRLGPEVLTGWEDRAVVTVDDLDLVLGDPAWETALFNLYNELAERRGAMVVATAAAPAALEFALPDLRSRLSAGAVFGLSELDEDDVGAALRLRARHRGLELPDETLRYLLRRVPRDISSLCGLLERLDVESLAEQRRLTVPFVRNYIAQDSDHRG